jgi:N-acetylated-alpha-linked acidic dipeptidase
MTRIALILSLTLAFVPAPSHAADVFGFAPDRAEAQLAREQQFDDALNVDNLRTWMEHMTTRPHNLGSPKAKENADYIAALFTSWGYDTHIETYHVLFPTPKTRSVKMLQPKKFTASLTEKVVAKDAVARAIKKEGLPGYNAYSADGDVTAPLVYINQGLPKDYEELERRGISVKGKIVIARYGGSWRGIKPKVAAEKGAVGCLIYNDPKADGYAQGDAYPDGAFKHKTAVQRGSIVDLPKRPGDPLTPDYAATKDAVRVSIEDSGTVMTIPVLPLSRADAEPILRALDGPVAPASWRGALPLTYRMGGGGGTVIHLKAKFNWDIVPCYNVIATLRGSEFPDQWVIRGNHHDAWVVGARDPISGLVPLLEQARAMSELVKTGWQPKRTVIFGVWDGEEPGLLGSVEWVEDHADELRKKAVAYINTDGNSRGFLNIGGSHTLETLADQVSRQVTDPQTGVSVYERRLARVMTEGTDADKKKWADGFALYALGSGSDYSAFLQHLGIASYNVGFGGEGSGGDYHTSFDTFDHFTRFIDPGFEYGIALAKVCGRLTMRLADADVLPFDFVDAQKTYAGYVDEVVKLADTMREETETYNAAVEADQFALAADPTKPYVAPERKERVPHINFALLLNGADDLKQAVKNLDIALAPVRSGEKVLPARIHAELNKVLYHSERTFIADAGLPRRPWFRHQIYAPGYYTGYGVKTLPGIREGIEEREWNETNAQIRYATLSIKSLAVILQNTADMVNKQ